MITFIAVSIVVATFAILAQIWLLYSVVNKRIDRTDAALTWVVRNVALIDATLARIDAPTKEPRP